MVLNVGSMLAPIVEDEAVVDDPARRRSPHRGDPPTTVELSRFAATPCRAILGSNGQRAFLCRAAVSDHSGELTRSIESSMRTFQAVHVVVQHVPRSLAQAAAG